MNYINHGSRLTKMNILLYSKAVCHRPGWSADSSWYHCKPTSSGRLAYTLLCKSCVQKADYLCRLILPTVAAHVQAFLQPWVISDISVASDACCVLREVSYCCLLLHVFGRAEGDQNNSMLPNMNCCRWKRWFSLTELVDMWGWI